MRLRSFVILGAVLQVLVGVGSAGGLVWMTTQFQRQTVSLSDAIERVRAASDLEITLLSLQTAHEAEEAGADVGPPVSVSELQSRVPARLREVEHSTETAEQQAQVAAVRAAVEAYLRAPPRARRQTLRTATAATEAVVSSSTARARTAREEAQRVSDAARLFGSILAVSVVVGVAVLLLGARTSVYRPLLSIRRAMAAFKSGQRDSRVDGSGLPELREIGAEFNDMAETLVTHDARQLQFLAGVAHDLRTPLNALKLSVHVLLRAPSPPPPEKVRESLTRVSKLVERLERMVGDLLDQTRIEAGNVELRLEECDVRGLVADVVELHRPSSEQHQLESIVPEVPVPLRCDPTRLSQVLTNLVNNAIKYSPRGGRVQVRLEQSADEVVLAVSDEGLGISPGELGRVFEPFSRSRKSSADIPGAGLGLSVSRRIVRAHGGDIEVESQVGVGSTFRVRLPSRRA